MARRGHIENDGEDFTVAAISFVQDICHRVGVGSGAVGDVGAGLCGPCGVERRRYLGMVAYASLALSLPVLSALLVGAVRLYPESLAGRFFAWLRAHKEQANAVGGYLVAVVLIVIGIMHV